MYHNNFEEMEQNESMVLEEVIDENYEPNQEEILEYAEYLGMNLPDDQDLLYIAREGLKAPLPEDWKPCKTKEGEIYYFNFRTGESQWDHPCDEYFKKKFVDAKRKKLQGKSLSPGDGGNQKVSKLKSKFPTSNKNVTNLKPEPLQHLQPGGKIKPKAIQPKTQPPANDQEPSFSADGGNSFSNPAAGESTKMSKSKGFFPGQQAESMDLKASQIGGSDLNNEFEQIDSEYENKLFDVQKELENELASLTKKKENEYQKQVHKHQNILNDELDELKEDLSSHMRSSKMEFFREKDKIKKEMQADYDLKYKEEALDQKKNFDKKKIDKELEIETEIQEEQASIKQIHEEKKRELVKRKTELLAEVDEIKKQEEKLMKDYEGQFDIEKQSIIEEFDTDLQRIEKEEREKQQQEVTKYKKVLKSKLDDEKKIYDNAEKQKEHMARQRLDDLKKEMQSKLAEEKEKKDIETEELLQAFEETEKARKENEIKKQEVDLLKKEKEKRRNKFKKELDEHKDTLDKRLDNYKSILREKYETEKSILDQQTDDTITELRKEVEDLQIDLNSKDDIMAQIDKLQDNESELQVELKSSIFKLSQIEKENTEKKNQFDNLTSQYKQKLMSKTGETKELLDELMKKSRNLDQELERQSKVLKEKQSIATNSQAGDTQQRFNQFSKGNSLLGEEREGRNMSKNASFVQRSNSFQKIVKEVTQIKSMLYNTFDGKEEQYDGQRQRSPPQYEQILRETPQVPDSESDLGFESEDGGLYHQEFTNYPKSTSDWKACYHQEKKKIDRLKEELRNDKLVLKRTQEYLARDQSRFKEDYEDYKRSYNRSPSKKQMIRKLRKTLNDQVRKLNDDVYRLRDNEFATQNKERALPNLHQSIQQFIHKKINREQLCVAYYNYKQLDFRYKTPLIREEQRMGSLENKFLSDRESKEFYEKWQDIIGNQLTYDIDASDTDQENTRQKYTSVYDQVKKKPERARSAQHKNPLDEAIQKLKTDGFVKTNNYVGGGTTTVGAVTSQAGYGYDNIIKMLDYQMKADAKNPNSQFVSKQINQSTENRYKLKSMFTDHSQWLSNMKTRLNKHLYDRPSSGKEGGYVFGLV